LVEFALCTTVKTILIVLVTYFCCRDKYQQDETPLYKRRRRYYSYNDTHLSRGACGLHYLLFKGLYQTQRNDSTHRMAPDDRYLNNAMNKYKTSRIHLRKQVNYT
jgi:hypothetical protein